MDVDGRTINRITDTFNGSLIFDPSEQQMAYTIRDPQHFGESRLNFSFYWADLKRPV